MQDTEASEPPNRWLITLLVVAFAQALSTGGISLVYPFLPIYVQSLQDAHLFNRELLAGLVIAAPPLMGAITTPFWGRLADKYGRKNMVIRALLCSTVILLLMAFAQTALALIFLRALQGLTSGIIAAKMALVAGECPRERMGFAFGALQVGLFGGVAIGPIAGGLLADQYGFQMPFFFTSAMLFLAALAVILGVRESYVPAKDVSLNIRPAELLGAWRDILRLQGVRAVFSLRFLNGFAQRSLMPIAPLFVLALLPSTVASASSYAGLVLTVSAIATTAGSFLLGWLSDHWGYRRTLLGAAFVAMMFYIPQAFVGSVEQLLLFQALAGLAAGGVLSAPAAMLANFTALGDEGSVYGLDASVTSFANGMAPLTASIIAAFFGLRAVFAVVALYYLLILLIGKVFLPKPKRQPLRWSPGFAGGD